MIIMDVSETLQYPEKEILQKVEIRANQQWTSTQSVQINMYKLNFKKIKKPLNQFQLPRDREATRAFQFIESNRKIKINKGQFYIRKGSKHHMM